MTYTWRCTQCRETVEVSRRMADCMSGPELEETVHNGCTGQVFTRVLVSPMAVHVHENEDQYFK